jgi:hypothetical protein
MAETPLEHVVLAVALKLTGEPAVLLVLGELMETPDEPSDETVIAAAAVVAPPQLSHAVITRPYFAGGKFRVVLRLAPFSTYANTPGEV